MWQCWMRHNVNNVEMLMYWMKEKLLNAFKMEIYVKPTRKKATEK